MNPMPTFILSSCVAMSALAEGGRPAPLETFREGGRALASDMLPSGAVKVGDAEFVLDPVLRATFDGSGEDAVTLVRWPEGRTASSVTVLHTLQPGCGVEDWRLATGLALRKLEALPDWPTVCTYELAYADGTTVDVPVRYGEGIREWRRVQTVGPMLWARETWTRDLDAAAGEKVALYAMRIPNPRPGQPLVSVSARTSGQAHEAMGKVLVLGLATDPGSPSGKLFFVARKPLGDDAQAGGYDAPFGTIQRALDVAGPGDAIYIRRGRYALDAPLVKKFDGEDGKWFTLSAFPGETPVLDAMGIFADPRVKPYGEGGNLPSLGQMQHDTGALHIWGDPRCTRVQGLTVVDSRRAGISVYGSKAAGAGEADWAGTRDVDVSFNTTLRSGSMGIITHMMDRLSILGNRVVRPHALEMTFDLETDGAASHVELPQEGIDLSNNRHFEVAFNTVVGGSKEAIDCISVRDGSIHHNMIDSCLNGIYIDSWSRPIIGVDIHHNFIRNAFNGIPLSTEGGNDLLDIAIHHNIVVDAKRVGIGVSEATYKARPSKVQRHRVYNNTVHGSGRHCIAIGWQAAGIDVWGYRDNAGFRDVMIRDNIVTATAGRPLLNTYATSAVARAIGFVDNLVWPTLDDTTPEWMRTAEKQWFADDLERGENTRVADPLYVNPERGDFRLREKSPALGLGQGGGDAGALPRGAGWIAGLDFAGNVTRYYRGDADWTPVFIRPDLYTLHRDNLQRPSWFQIGRYGPDFRQLPDGEQSLAGVTWQIAPMGSSFPNVLALSGHSSESAAESIEGLAIGRKASRMAFLHTVHIADRKALADGSTLFHYRVHYADGAHVDVPVRLGQEVDTWYQGKPTDLRSARLAWTLPVLQRNGRDRAACIALYSHEWKNPRPDAAITAVDIVRDAPKLSATPAVFAISTAL